MYVFIILFIEMESSRNPEVSNKYDHYIVT